MKKASLFKKVLSILLCLCMVLSLLPGLSPRADAAAGALIANAIGKKAVELGLRFACKAAGEMTASTATETDDKIVGSIIQYVILDGQGATINKIDKTCEAILSELFILERNVKEYTSQISTAIDQEKVYDAKKQYADKWESDVSNVLSNNNTLTEPAVQESYDLYVKYLIATYLNVNGKPENEAVCQAMEEFWSDKYHSDLTEAEYSDQALAELKEDLELAFLQIHDPMADLDSRDSVYNSAYVYNFYTSTINTLVDNYLYDGISTSEDSYTVMESAATDAYYIFPFSHQQYEFVTSAAKKQIMTVTLLEMALNEYLSMQGQYLAEKTGTETWDTDVALTYLNNAGTTSETTYAKCTQKYAEMVASDLEQAVYLMESDIDINTTAYTGVAENLTLKLSDYMKPEDAQAVLLTVDGYSTSHDYTAELKANNFDCSGDVVYKNGTNITNSQYIPEKISFYRVMSGNNAQEVYYILDTTQFGSSDVLSVKSLAHRIRRTNYNDRADGMYGDLFVASNDYLNMIKPMSDSTNRFAVPSNLNNKLGNLFSTPIFSARYGLSPSQYLQQYIPTASGTTHFLTANYDNRLVDDKPLIKNLSVVSGVVTLGKTNSATNNVYELQTESLKHQNILAENPGQYTVILANTSDTYQQTLSLKLDDQQGNVSDAYIVYGDSPLGINEQTVLNPGDEFTVYFKIASPGCLNSLSMVRKNASDQETVLLNADDLNLLEADENGYYSYTATMPYSQTDIIITSQQPPVQYASATIGRFTAPYLVEKFQLEYNGQVLQDEGEAMEVICGDPMDLVVDMKSYAYLDRVSMITDGVETTLFNQENYKNILTDRGDGTFALTVTMPEKDTRFAIYTVSEDCPTLTLTRDDPREAIYQFNAAVGEYYVSSEPVPAGSEITLSIFLKGANAFYELTMVTGGERTVLLDKQTFLENVSANNSYTLTVTMPSSDTEIILSTLPIGETYEPTGSLQINEDGSFLIYTYDDLRSMAYFINNNLTFYNDQFYIPYVDGHYILMNDIDVENRELETISKNSDTPFSGSFEGNGYTISNYTILADSIYTNGLFGFVNGDIRNLKLAGQYTVRNISIKDTAYPCTLAYKISGNSSVTNVQTQVTLTLEGFTSAAYISGIAYSVETGCVIDRCLVRDTVNLPDMPITAYAGIFSSTLSYQTYSITNCGVVSTVNVKSCDNAYGIFHGGSQSTYNLHNCYSACTFSDSITNRYALCNTTAKTINATNCYYLDILSQNGDLGTAAAMEQFNSGEITYLLQGGVTETDAEGNQLQTWGQNIDGEGEKDLYPMLSDDTVYYVTTGGCCDTTFAYVYSNDPTSKVTHNYQVTQEEPTCTENGSNLYSCPDCGQVTSEVIPALGHDYDYDKTDPTCTEDGIIAYTCTRCGDAYTETLPATGHDYDIIVGIVDATCTEDGTITYACVTCGNTCDEVIAATDHSYVETARVEPTCTEDGSVTYTCEYCGDSYTETLPATGHDYGDDDTCDNCDEVTTAIELLYPTLTFKDEVMYNIYFKVHDLTDIPTSDMGMILFDSFLPEGTVEDAVEIISGAEDTSAGYKVSSSGIPAKNMGDDIHFRIYIRMANGEYLYTPTLSYSAIDYAKHILAGDNSQAQKQIVVAMLNYGAEAQKYFSYKTDTLMNADLTEEQLASIEDYRSDMMNTVAVPDSAKTANFAATGGFTKLYPSINFTGAFAINYYCTPVNTPVGDVTLYYWNQNDCYAADVLTVDNATGAIPMIAGTDGYTTAVEGIAAKDLDKGVFIAMVYSDGTATYSSGVVSYSIGTYCKSQAAKNNGLSPLAAATAVYSYYAKQLFYTQA